MSTVGLIGMEEEESEAAAEGTAAHELAASILLGEPCRGNDKLVRVYTDEVERIASLGKASDVLVEERLLHPTHETIGGIVDALVWDRRERNLTVLDLKYGFRRVEVEENDQLLLYAWLFALTRQVSPVKVTLEIVQPRADHPKGPIRSWSTDLLGLIDFGNKVTAAIKRVGIDCVEVVGDHCLYCKRAPLCKSLRESNQVVIGEAENLAKGLLVSPDRLAKLIDQIPRAAAMLKALWSYAEGLASRGVDIPGYVLDADSFGKRKWVNWEKTEEFLKSKGLTEEQVYQREPSSPTQVESFLTPDDKVALREHTTRERLAPKLVKIKNAKNPTRGIKASDVFKRIEHVKQGE